LPQENQTCYGQRDFTRDVIAYEGLRKVGLRAQDAGKTPMACGDPLGGRWGGGPYVTDFSLYGSSHVGLMAAVIERTDDPSILQIDCLKTDFFHDKAYPTYLYFNPHAEEKDVRLDVGDKPVDLFDAVTHSFLKRGVQGKTMVRLPADGAVVLVLAPAGGKVSRQGRKLLIDGVVVDYRAGSANQTKE
jgi:hypothetical protein